MPRLREQQLAGVGGVFRILFVAAALSLSACVPSYSVVPEVGETPAAEYHISEKMQEAR